MIAYAIKYKNRELNNQVLVLFKKKSEAKEYFKKFCAERTDILTIVKVRIEEIAK